MASISRWNFSNKENRDVALEYLVEKIGPMGIQPMDSSLFGTPIYLLEFIDRDADAKRISSTCSFLQGTPFYRNHK